MNRDRDLAVMVTAGAEKQSLAAVRSLGRAGALVHVLDPKPDAPAFRSRWTRARFVSPSNHDRDRYLAFLLERVRDTRYTTILPCDDPTATLLSEERARFAPHVALALPDAAVFRQATDKLALMRLAREAGVPVPRTEYPQTAAEAAQTAAALGYPVIVKGGHGWGAQHVRLVAEPAQLESAFEDVRALEAMHGGGAPMLQEFVRGTGYGFSTLFRHGAPRAAFMHRRAFEFDVAAGGAPYSCPMAESVDEPELRRLGLLLFEALGWHGLGMAEWRRETTTGRFVLMEINPRLVGSTDLAVRAGVDLPLLACRMLRDGDVLPVLQHPAGVRLRWWLPDGLRDLLAQPERVFARTTWSTPSDWAWTDLAPHWLQVRRTAWALRHDR